MRKRKYSKESVLDFVNDYWLEHYMSPSIEEIRVGLGIKSKATVYYLLSELEMDGILYIRRGYAHGVIPNWVESAIDSA